MTAAAEDAARDSTTRDSTSHSSAARDSATRDSGVDESAAGRVVAGRVVADRRIAGALLRYRVLAYVVGVGLIVLVFVGVPLRYAADIPKVSQTVSPIHGLLYMVYLVLTVDLAMKCKFSAKTTVAIMLAGTIPFLSFVAERRVSRLVRSRV